MSGEGNPTPWLTRSARLIKFTVETIRTKLDRIFLESLQAAKRSNKHEEVSREQVHGLQEEVESLFSEILPVAQMSVEQQYLEPALKSLSEKNGRSVTRTSEAIVYVCHFLGHQEPKVISPTDLGMFLCPNR